MSERFNSRAIAYEAYDDIGGDPIVSLHQFTKAVLAVLARHGFLDIVDEEIGANKSLTGVFPMHEAGGNK